MIYCDTNKNTHFIFNGEWDNGFNSYSGMYVITEHNDMYVAQNLDGDILTIENTLPSVWTFLGLEDVRLLSGPVELMSEYTRFHYKLEGEDNYKKVSLNQVNIEFVEVQWNINETLNTLKRKLETFYSNYEETKNSDRINRKVVVTLKALKKHIILNDIYSVYVDLDSIKTQIKADKDLLDFIHKNIGPFNTSDYDYQDKLLAMV
jgi:hypothetical protein